ncbi:hypothetical protein [Croceibacterium ferulae]|uniref:hypothetical protein n=1 Tax=Croceibacterium ferulae TaxID=1854641 RepID=UPI000F87D1F0|nr:hypothetical protein [Croceibacterium ferulae]
MSKPRIFAFLVQPGKSVEPPPALNGKPVESDGKLFGLLNAIFHADPDKSDFEVTFKPTAQGSKQNDCRDLILSHLKKRSLSTAQALAARLQNVTDRRPGTGLLFIMSGKHGTKTRLVVSRFPANEAILAEVREHGLNVELLDQVFIKKFTAYKALRVEHDDLTEGFWSGYASDRQAGGSPENMSSYWLDDFLTADFSETPKAGTRRLAEALKKAVKLHPDLSVKNEIASAVSLAPSALSGKKVSIDSFCIHFGLSSKAEDTIRASLTKPSLSSKVFKFDGAEFIKRVPYRSVQMETGAILTAPSDEFEDLFDKEDRKDGSVRYSTAGFVKDQRMTRK